MASRTVHKCKIGSNSGFRTMTSLRTLYSSGKCELPTILNGTLHPGYEVGNFVTHGSRLRYTCSGGFTSDDEHPDCYNGTWTRLPRCLPGMRVPSAGHLTRRRSLITNENQIYNARKVTPKCESEARIDSHHLKIQLTFQFLESQEEIVSFEFL